MLIYWLMLLIPGALWILLLPLREDFRNRVVISVFFLIFGTMLAVRSINCGVDLQNYEYYFHSIASIPWNSLYLHELEFGYVFYVKLVTCFTDSYQVFIAVTAVLSLAPIMWLYCRDCRCAFLQIVIFVNMSIFPMFFSGLRQTLAISIGAMAYAAVRDGKTIKYLLLTGLAWLFHESGFILLMLYPMYHIRIKQKHALFISVVLGILLLCNEQVFLLLGSIAEILGISYTVSITQTGAYTTIILFLMFYYFALFGLDEERADAEDLGLRNMLLLALVIQFFAPLHGTASRMGYYFLVFIPILIPRVVTKPKKQFTQVMTLAHMVMCLFFVFYFLQNAYTGQDILRIYPYIPFWEGY